VRALRLPRVTTLGLLAIGALSNFRLTANLVFATLSHLIQLAAFAAVSLCSKVVFVSFEIKTTFALVLCFWNMVFVEFPINVFTFALIRF
jgi:hypothetical protein